MFPYSPSSPVSALLDTQSPSGSRIAQARQVGGVLQRGGHVELSHGAARVEQGGNAVASAADSKGMAERQAVTEGG
jgi:hypothetical protein